MPFYEVHHTHPLSTAQQDQLAASITHIHSRLFTTPALFVHVAFTNNDVRPMYMAGKKRRSNMIIANVRHGPGRTKDHYTKLCNQIGDAWKATVVAGYANGSAATDGGIVGGEVVDGPVANGESAYVQTDENKLRAIFVMGSILTGWEGGFMIPDAGKDKEWFQENLPEMRQKAEEGDGDMAEMLAEIETREEFQSIFAEKA